MNAIQQPNMATNTAAGNKVLWLFLKSPAPDYYDSAINKTKDPTAHKPNMELKLFLAPIFIIMVPDR